MNSQQNRKIGSVINMINMIVSLLLGLIYTPILIKYLGDSEYGIYTLAISLIAYLSILDLGFGNALVRYTARVRAKGEDERDLIGMFLVLYSIVSVIAAAIGIVVYYNMEAFFSTSITENEAGTLRVVYIIMLINTVIAFPASVFSSIIRSHEKFVFSNLINTLKKLLSHVIMIILVIIGFKSTALAFLSLIATLIVLIINLYYCFTKLEIKIGFKKFDRDFYKEVLVYSAFILLNIIVDQLYANTDKIILGKYCGSIAVAIYGVGVTFQQYYQEFSTSISSVFFSHVSKLSVKQNAIEEMSGTFIRIGRIQLILLSFVAIGFAAFGKEFVNLWVGNGYDDAYYIALIIMIPSLIPLSQNIGISILQALNRHQTRAVMYLVIAIINVLLSIPLAIRFGGVGSAIGTAVGLFLGEILFMNWYYWKKIGIDIPLYWKNTITLVLKLIPVLLVFLVTAQIRLQGWIGLVVKALAAIVLIIPYYYFLVLNSDEKRLVNTLCKKIVK